MRGMLGDVRYALRRLGRSPGFAVVAVLTLALGIGATTAIFSVVNALLIRDLPVRSAETLVDVYQSDSDGFRYSTASYPDYLDVKAADEVFASVIAHQSTALALRAEDASSEIVIGELVSANYFSALGVDADLGRPLVAADGGVAGGQSVVVLSREFWERRFGGDPDVVGSTLVFNGQPLEVVGVASFPGTFPVLRTNYWVPLSLQRELNISDTDRLASRGSRSLFMKARLRPGVTVERAQAAMSTLAGRLARAYPETNADRELTVVPTTSVSLNPALDRALVPAAALLMVVVVLVLLLASTNLASLLLARATTRRHEIATRLAMGAGRWRLIRMLLSESVLVALIGGAAGVGVAYGAVELLMRFTPPVPVSVALDVAPDGTVLIFALVLSIFTGLAFGLAPALRSTRRDVVSDLKGDASGDGPGRRFGLRDGLVSAQVVMSVLLLITAGLFVRSLQRASHIDPGFRTERFAMLMLDLQQHGYETEEAAAFFERLRDRAEALPGVEQAALANRLPLGYELRTRHTEVEGAAPDERGRFPSYDVATVSGGYFDALDIDIVRGRAFTPADAPGTRPVVVVSEAAARRFWPGDDPLGKRLRSGQEDWHEVVGVARDTKVRTLGEDPRPYIYYPFAQERPDAAWVLVTTAGPPAEVLPPLRELVASIDPSLGIFDSRTAAEHLALMIYPARMGALLLAVFGGLALVLASMGLYGLVSFAVEQRTREIGIRMALGARARDVVRTMLGQAAVPLAIGTGTGIALALAATRLLSRFLYGIGVGDPVAFIAVPGFLVAVALLASWVPARRAARTDPMEALRYE